MNEISTRYSGLVSNTGIYDYHIFGCGAIGSSVAVQLARLGAAKIHLYDHGKVEEVNVGVSEYVMANIARSKTEALGDLVQDINGWLKICRYQDTIGADTKLEKLEGIAILAFDNMAVRRIVAEKVCNSELKVLIDGRMGGEMFQMYTLEDPQIEDYMKTWYSDEQGSYETCTTRATPYCSAFAGSMIVSNIKKILTKQPYFKEVSFHFPSMTWEIK